MSLQMLLQYVKGPHQFQYRKFWPMKFQYPPFSGESSKLNLFPVNKPGPWSTQPASGPVGGRTKGCSCTAKNAENGRFKCHQLCDLDMSILGTKNVEWHGIFPVDNLYLNVPL